MQRRTTKLLFMALKEATLSSYKTCVAAMPPREFVAYQQEGHDGYDTIEWAAAQSWSNGSVGTFGLSYPGAVQWLAAIENPPHLKAMVPAMTFSTPQNFFFAWGTWEHAWIDWIWNNIAPDIRVKKNLPGPKTLRTQRTPGKTSPR